MEIKDSFGRNPVKETISVDERKDVPLYMLRSSYDNMKEIVKDPFKGSPVQNNDKVVKNKSDYTQRG